MTFSQENLKVTLSQVNNKEENTNLDTPRLLCYDFQVLKSINAVTKRVHFWKFYREFTLAERDKRKRMEDGF